MPEKKRESSTASVIASAIPGLDKLYKKLGDPPKWLSKGLGSLRRGSLKPGRPEGSGLVAGDEARLDRMEDLCCTEKIDIPAAARRVAKEEDTDPDRWKPDAKRLRGKFRDRHPDW